MIVKIAFTQEVYVEDIMTSCEIMEILYLKQKRIKMKLLYMTHMRKLFYQIQVIKQ